MTRPEPQLITRLRLAAERSSAVSAPEDWKRSAVGHFTYAEAAEAMAWIADMASRCVSEETLHAWLAYDASSNEAAIEINKRQLLGLVSRDIANAARALKERTQR